MLLLADVPHLVDAVGDMRWREWGDEAGREDLSFWVGVTRQEAGRDELPVTFIAVDPEGNALGAVGLGEYDIPERRDRSPWVLGMIVVPEQRGRGVGRHLLEALEAFADGRGYRTIWVATGPRAVGFYERCGWRSTEQLTTAEGETTVLARELR